MAGRRVVVEFLGEDKSLSKTAGKTERETSKLGKTLSTVGKTAALGLAGGLAAGTVALVGMAKGAAEDEKAQAILAKTLKNTAGATDAQVASVEAYISKVGEATGVTDDEMRPALANLLRATKDVDKAQGLMNLALDVSAGTGKSLESVTMALSKAQNGSVGGLSKLGLATKDAAGKTLSFEQIQKNLAKTFGGAAAAGAQTLDGKMARLKLIFAETQETIGAKLLPVATQLADWFLKKGIPAISSFAGWVERNKDVLKPLAIGFGVVTAAVWLLNIAMSANPISLIVIGIAALAAGLVVAYKRSEAFRKIVNTAFAVVKDAISDVINVGTAVIKFFRELPGTVSRALGDTKKWLVQKGKDMMAGLFGGIVAYLRSIRSAGAWIYKNVISPTIGSFAAAASWLVSAGKNVIIGLVKGYVAYLRFIGGIGVWIYKNVISPTIGVFGKAVTWLVSAGKNVVIGLVTGLVAYLRLIGGIGSWVYRNVVTPVVALFTNASQWLVAGGRMVISGLVSGFLSYLKFIGGAGVWLYRNVVTPAVSVFKNASVWLVQRGKDVLGGFWTGMSSKWSEVTKWVSGIATWIKNNKGPVSLDARLLVPAGQAIMSGFLKGLKAGAAPAWDFVKSVGGKTVDALRNVQEGVLPQGISNMPKAFQKILFRGKLVNRRTAAMIMQAEQILGGGHKYHITQGSYSHGVKASGTTHHGGGVVDTNGPGGWARATSALRAVGFAAWHRSPSQGPWGHHIHAVDWRDPTASSSAKAQGRDFLAGGDGLAGYRQGTPWVPEDQLAFLHQGEGVIPAEVNRQRLRGGGGGVVINFNGIVTDPIRAAKEIQKMLLNLKHTNGDAALGLT